MSSRYNNFDKGSSRSNRADSRTHKVRHWEDRGQERERSRSPRRRPSPPRSRHFEERSSKSRDRDYNEERKDDRGSPSNWSDEEVPAPPPPPRITKISIGFTKPKAPIKMNIGGPAKQAKVTPKATVASIFNADDDDDDEPEEMPAEARMRMRNIGRETPTSAGPNSFGKTKQGFCDAKKVFEKNMKQAMETDGSEKPVAGKFPQTIYKIKGP